MKTTVYKNASIVTGISVAERALGFLYRIVLSRRIGAEGLGLYQVALSILSLLSTLAAGGIPITLSRMIAKSQAENKPKEGNAVFTAGLLASLSLTLPFALLLCLFGGKIPFLFADERSFSVFRILLVGVLFSAVYATIRGYLWGNKRFFAASLIELAEEIAMVLIGVFLVKSVPSPTVGAERAAWALTLADVLSCLVAVVVFFLLGGKLSKPKNTLKPLFNASLPITSVRLSSSLVNSAVAVLFPAMLIRAGFSQSDALKIFGVISGMVLPVLFIPSTLIGSLSLVLVPELSADFSRKDTKALQQKIERGLQFAFLVACALIPFFFVLGEELGGLAFSNPQAGKMIAKSCVVLLPMSLTMISTSILNSIGFEKQTFLFYFFGAAALLIGVLLPSLFGEYAYLVGLFASFLVTAVCNLSFLRKKCPIFENRGGQVCVQTLLPAVISILPLSLFGEGCKAFFSHFFGEALCLMATGLCLAVATAAIYLFARLLPVKFSSKKTKEI